MTWNCNAYTSTSRETSAMPRWPLNFISNPSMIMITIYSFVRQSQFNVISICIYQFHSFRSIFAKFLQFSICRYVAFYALAWSMIQHRIHVSVYSSHNVRFHCATQHSPHSWCSALSIWLAKSFVTSKYIGCAVCARHIKPSYIIKWSIIALQPYIYVTCHRKWKQKKLIVCNFIFRWPWKTLSILSCTAMLLFLICGVFLLKDWSDTKERNFWPPNTTR